MGPLDAIKTCLAKSFQFKGRASRSEFWWPFAVFAVLAFFLLWPYATVFSSETRDVVIFKTSAVTGETTQTLERQTSWFLYRINWNLITLITVLLFYGVLFTVTVRRLHDVGSSAWFGLALLLAGPATMLAINYLIPLTLNLSLGVAMALGFILSIASWIAWLICPAILLILLSQPSEEGTTEYGPNPNEVPQ